jgi:hypothetical protein
MIYPLLNFHEGSISVLVVNSFQPDPALNFEVINGTGSEYKDILTWFLAYVVEFWVHNTNNSKTIITYI